jgi:hypothetical protein
MPRIQNDLEPLSGTAKTARQGQLHGRTAHAKYNRSCCTLAEQVFTTLDTVVTQRWALWARLGPSLFDNQVQRESNHRDYMMQFYDSIKLYIMRKSSTLRMLAFPLLNCYIPVSQDV